jgi:hypothetical protein
MVVVAGGGTMETGLSSLEKELKQWRENRSSRALETVATLRQRTFSSPASGGRRVQVNGQEVLVVSKSKRQ